MLHTLVNDEEVWSSVLVQFPNTTEQEACTCVLFTS